MSRNTTFEELVRKLAARTNAGEVNWRPTADEQQYVVNFDHFSLAVWARGGEHPNHEVITFTIRDESGQPIEQFSIDRQDEPWNAALTVYAGARRKALHIDTALQEMLQQLDREQPVGAAPDEDLPWVNAVG